MGVDGVDRGLELVRAGLIAAKAAAHDRFAFVDHPAVPPRSVLVRKEDD